MIHPKMLHVSRAIALLFGAILAASGPMRAAADEPGVFDYYVLALSWNAAWCEREGDARDAAQCDDARDLGFSLHGLWPQYETGYPQDCRGTGRNPGRAETQAMADIMGSGGLAWHQWRKHGRCAGLSPEDYFALSRKAYEMVVRPEVLRQIPREMSLPPKVIEQAFLEDNPMASPDSVTVTCRDGAIQEVRICLTRDLAFRQCGRDVRADCPASRIDFPPMR